MFRWYRDAVKCYVYLADISTTDASSDPAFLFKKSRRFTRGWTLQEFVAPASVEFFPKEGVYLGSQKLLEQAIHDATDIPPGALRGGRLSEFSVAGRIKWIQKRSTKRQQDRAYSLLGMFDVYMPLLYGEGEKNAFRRLRGEIGRTSRGEAKRTSEFPGISTFRSPLTSLTRSMAAM